MSEIAEMLRLSHTLARKPGTLSGGEQQRCAIGRALVRRPKLLLLDEPLTNLDAKLRHDTRAEFKRLHRELGDTTMIYATPDQLEALSMGQRIGVLDLGRIVQIGTPQALYGEPKNTFVASLVGDPPINLVAATLRNTTGGRILETAFADIDATPWAAALKDFGHGTDLRAGLRPQTLQPAQGAARGPRFEARIVLTEPLGDVTILNLQPAKGERLKIVLPQEQAYEFKTGEELTCEIDPAQIVLFAAGTGVAISRSQGATTQGAAMR